MSYAIISNAMSVTRFFLYKKHWYKKQRAIISSLSIVYLRNSVINYRKFLDLDLMQMFLINLSRSVRITPSWMYPLSIIYHYVIKSLFIPLHLVKPYVNSNFSKKKMIFSSKIFLLETQSRVAIMLRLCLNFGDFYPRYAYKRYAYKRN